MTVVHSIVDDPDQLKLIETWRLRHAYPDAIGIWAASSGLEARAFAFNAIAQDPRVLRRAERLVAIKMATQAEDFASSLAVSDIAKSDTWIAIALYVQRSIDMWRRSFRAYDRQGETTGMSAGATIQQARLSDPWEIARRNFPYVEDDTGMIRRDRAQARAEAVGSCHCVGRPALRGPAAARRTGANRTGIHPRTGHRGHFDCAVVCRGERALPDGGRLHRPWQAGAAGA
jgi:hypothetical protein